MNPVWLITPNGERQRSLDPHSGGDGQRLALDLLT